MNFEKSENKDKGTEEELKEKIKKSAIEKARQKVTIVNIEDLAEKESRDAADAYMTETKENLKGFKGMMKKIWKHTFVDEYYRQREVNRVKREIKQTGDIYTREEGTKEDHEKAMNAITERFSSEYEGTISKGEEKKILNQEDGTAVKAKEDIKKIISDYAKSSINEETFASEKSRIINDLKNDLKKEDLLKGADNYADNLFEIAKNARIAIEHGAKMEELDLDTSIIIGKAKSGIKTESNFNVVDKAVDRYKKTKFGRIVSPTVIAASLGIAYCIAINTSKKLASSRAAQLMTLGGAAVVSGAFVGLNESQRVTNEKRQHSREMAKGQTFKEGDKRREEMDKYTYDTKTAKELTEELKELMSAQEEGKEIKKEDIDKIMAALSDIEARNSLADKKNIDLISYSSGVSVEKERTDLAILTAQTKVELKAILEGELKGFLPEGETFDSYLTELVAAEERALLGGEKGIDAQDKAFSRMKTRRVAKKVATTILVGFAVGAGVQEISALFNPNVQGLVEGMFKHEHGAGIQTPLEHLRGIMSGHPSHMGLANAHEQIFDNAHIKLPDGVNMIKNPDGTFDILRGDQVISDNIQLNFSPSGELDTASMVRLGEAGIVGNTIHHVVDSTKETIVNGDNYVNNHLENTKHIARDLWYDNNTPKPVFDQNELKLWYGGEGNNGIDANGNYVFNVKHMTSEGSFHDSFSTDAQEKIKAGGLKVMLSLTQGTQNHVFEVPVDINGNAIIDPHSEVGKLFFSTENGHAVFHGRFAEVAETFGQDENGAEHVKVLSTYEGPGRDTIKDTVTTIKDSITTNLDMPISTQPPYYIPIPSRRPLETTRYPKKKGPNDEGPVFGPSGPWSGEDKKAPSPIPVKESEKKINEINQEESDGMREDMKMLNRKVRTAAGIITVEESDFKSEYGKKRYMDLKSILGGIPVTFNKGEMQTIGDEIETILVNSRIKSNEEPTPTATVELTQEEKDKIVSNNMKSDLGMINKLIQGGKGILSVDELDFKSEYGRDRYKELEHIAEGKPVTFSKEELEKIGEGLEGLLSTPINPTTPVEEKTPEKEKDAGIIDYGGFDESKEGEEKKFKIEDLSKAGTVFETKEGLKFKVTNLIKSFFGSNKVEGILTDKNGKENLISYKLKQLEEEFRRGNIKITKVEGK